MSKKTRIRASYFAIYFIYKFLNKKRALRWGLVVVLMAIIFLLDTFTDLEIAVAVLYVVVIIFAEWFFQALYVAMIAFACILLMMMSFILSRTGEYSAGTLNLMLSVCAISATTYLALKRSAAVLAEHNARLQLARVARMNSLGEMSASIAHEVNQPLTSIVTSGNACLNWLAVGAPALSNARQSVERIIQDANRASSIVTRIRNLSTRTSLQAKWIGAVDVVNETLALCRSEFTRNHISVEIKLKGPHSEIFVDAIQIQQVLLNIFLNASESMSSLGEPQKRMIFVSISRNSKNFVQFSIIDNGSGIRCDDIENVFDPFFTTKSDGIGIGLTISRSIVEYYGGRIWAVPRKLTGAEFCFTLPGRFFERVLFD